jgi:hypothetical protein
MEELLQQKVLDMTSQLNQNGVQFVSLYISLMAWAVTVNTGIQGIWNRILRLTRPEALNYTQHLDSSAQTARNMAEYLDKLDPSWINATNQRVYFDYWLEVRRKSNRRKLLILTEPTSGLEPLTCSLRINSFRQCQGATAVRFCAPYVPHGGAGFLRCEEHIGTC